jgi:hypothetical protein
MGGNRTIKFTVLLMYPLHMTDGEIECYHSHVEADNIKNAIRYARNDVVRANACRYAGKEFKILAVYIGGPGRKLKNILPTPYKKQSERKPDNETIYQKTGNGTLPQRRVEKMG